MTMRRNDSPAGRTRMRTVDLLVIGGPAVAFLLLTLAVTGAPGPVQHIDAAVSAVAHTAALAHPTWRRAMTTVTATGSTTVIMPIATVGCLLLMIRGLWRPALFAATALITTIELRLVVVTAVARPRPADQLVAASNFSFPSGHSTASATVALVAVVVCRPMLRHRWQRIALIVTAAVWAVAVGVSRVALVVHWPSDVLGAWLFVAAVVPAVRLSLSWWPRLQSPPPPGSPTAASTPSTT